MSVEKEEMILAHTFICIDIIHREHKNSFLKRESEREREREKG